MLLHSLMGSARSCRRRAIIRTPCPVVASITSARVFGLEEDSTRLASVAIRLIWTHVPSRIVETYKKNVWMGSRVAKSDGLADVVLVSFHATLP